MISFYVIYYRDILQLDTYQYRALYSDLCSRAALDGS